MLAVKLEESPIVVVISFLSEEVAEMQKNLIPTFLSDLKDEISGRDESSGTDYNCTLKKEFRSLNIRAARRAWSSYWNADFQVISSDRWSLNDDKVRLVCQYLFGPSRNVSGQAIDAINAAEMIKKRIADSLDVLTKDSEKYKGKIEIEIEV